MLVYVDENQTKRVIEALDSIKNARPVIKSALNATAKRAQKKLIERAAQVYIYKKRFTNKDLKRQNATVANLTARLYASGEGIEIYHFSANGPKAWSQTVKGAPATKGRGIRKNPARYLQRRKGSSDNLKAFIARMPSGHVTVVRRTEESERRNKKTGLGARYLETVLSTSVPGMLGNEEKVWNYISPDLGIFLAEETSRALAKKMGSLK